MSSVWGVVAVGGQISGTFNNVPSFHQTRDAMKMLNSDTALDKHQSSLNCEIAELAFNWPICLFLFLFVLLRC